MWENSNYILSTRSDQFYPFEQVMLSAGNNRYFLPMHFLCHDDQVTIHYRCSGFTPLSAYRIEHTADALFIAERVFLILHHAAEYLIDPCRIMITKETVFYHTDGSELRIAFVPLPQTREDQTKALILFLAQLKQDLTDVHGEYLDRLAKYLYYQHPDTLSLLTQAGRLRRDYDRTVRGAE